MQGSLCYPVASYWLHCPAQTLTDTASSTGSVHGGNTLRSYTSILVELTSRPPLPFQFTSGVCTATRSFQYGRHSSLMAAMIEGIKGNKNTFPNSKCAFLKAARSRRWIRFHAASASARELRWEASALPHLRVVAPGVVQQSQTDVVQSLDFTGVVVEALKRPTADVP